MPLTSKGFERLSYNEILNKKIMKAKELFGEDIDTSALTPLGKFIRINAYDLAEACEEAEYIYYSIFPGSARGVSLDRLCVFVGITRNPAVEAKYRVKIKGSSGTKVPVGFLVGTLSGISFFTVEEKEIKEGECDVNVWCSEAGKVGNVPPESIKQIINPAPGITSVVGVELVEAGTEDETDYELRKRFEEAREGTGSCTEAAIKAAVSRVPTVTSAGIVVNSGLEPDGKGRPGKSFECYINGGENYHELIAQTIFEKTPIGIKTVGSEEVVIKDESGKEHTVKFSHTTKVNVYVRLRIRTDLSYEGEKGKTEVVGNIMGFINGLGIGEDVILSSLYGKAHAVTGVLEVTELSLSKNGEDYFSRNIDVEEWEIANCANVNVEVVQL